VERCPLSSGNAPGFFYDENIPELCEQRCRGLLETVIRTGAARHEEYSTHLYEENAECPHPASEFGNSTLQAVALDSARRFYTITERCTTCSEEIAEDSFEFDCPYK
jgi:hypothetical protein